MQGQWPRPVAALPRLEVSAAREFAERLISGPVPGNLFGKRGHIEQGPPMSSLSRAPVAGAFCVFALLSACGGGGTNPIAGGNGGGPGATPDPSVSVPATISNNLASFAYVPGANEVRLRINGLDTTPLDAVWTRDPRFDTAGFTAFSVQEDPLDRFFVGLARESASGTARAMVAGDGGQFNRTISGAQYARSGDYAPPISTTQQGSGQVSYAGTYAGITNVGVVDGGGLAPVPVGTAPELLPRQPALVRGQIFLNANFSDNRVNGAIYDRVLVIDATDPSSPTQSLQSVVLVPTDILGGGGFEGKVERWVVHDPNMQEIGTYAGVFAGVGAADMAGAISIAPIYQASGAALTGSFERGIFVLRQCGLSGDDAICDTVQPDISNP